MDSLLQLGHGVPWRAPLAPEPSQLLASQLMSQADVGIAWIDTAARLARSGCVHAAVLAVSLAWSVAAVARGRRKGSAAADVTSSKIRLPSEICSQIARAAALGLVTAGAVRTGTQRMNVLLVGLAFILGLLRPASSLKWRHVILHQVNFLLGASFALLLAAELLPLLAVHSEDRPDATVVGAFAGVSAALVVALVTPRERVSPAVELDAMGELPESEPAPEETCSWFNLYFTFEWMTPLVLRGLRRQVALDELPALPRYDEPLLLLARILAAREKGKTTFRAGLIYLRRELGLMALWIGLANALELVAPFATYQLLAYLAAPDAALYRPGLWLFLMFAGPMANSVTAQQYVFTSTRLVVRYKSAVTQELYVRAMSSMEMEEDVLHDPKTKGGPAPAQKSTAAGRLANLMASDIDAITNSRDILQVVVGSPIGLAISITGLYSITGWSALVGASIIILGTPLPVKLAQIMGRRQRNVKAAQDARISLISEYLGSIRAVKYLAWEDAMTRIVDQARDKEQKELWGVSVIYTVTNAALEMMPIIAVLVIFTLQVAVAGQRLTAAVAFTTLSLVRKIRQDIAMAGFLSRNVTNAAISLGRLDRYFESTVPLAKYPTGPLRIQKASFRRNRKAAFALRDISVDFVEGGLNVVRGASGSGKTTLLLAILGETILEAGSVTKPDDVAFSSQSAWLQSGTVRENILFNSPLEEARYERVINACCLPVDLGELARGDETEIGENGASLSGGQRARVALARALYSKAPLLLLDDIFSALDAKTAASVWELCFCGDLLRGRTVVLVTQLPWVAAQADLAVTLENGSVERCEPNAGVVRQPVVTVAKDALEEDQVTNSDSHAVDDRLKAAEPKLRKDDIATEMDATGRTARLSVFQYMLHFGSPLYAVFAVFMSTLFNVVFVVTTLWLSVWVNAYSKKEAVDIGFYLGVFAIISGLDVIVYGGLYLTYSYGAWVAARRLHSRLLRSVMNVSLSWYKYVPVGRVVNRFSKDMASLDSTMSRLLLGTMNEFIKLFFRIGAVSSIMPIFTLPALLTCLVGGVCGEMYTRCAVVVKRLVASSYSPLFSQFSDSIAGLAVIRARADMPEAFRAKLADKLRAFSRSQEAAFNLNRWVAMRIDFVTALAMTCAGAIAISKAGLIPAGLIGFSLTNATGLGQTILMLVRMMNDLEVELQSFQRVKEYAALEPEDKTDDPPREAAPGAESDERAVPEDWPRSGAIEFRSVTIRYDVDGPDILKDVSLKFEAGERVAVVGRTGSGKSTLVLSLLRFTHVVSGTILYDGVDITAIPRKRLRQALTVIPQEAVLFNGTVGSNLDPSGRAPREVLEDALSSCAGIAAFQFHRRDDQPGAEAEAEADELPGATETAPLLPDGDGDRHAPGYGALAGGPPPAAGGLDLSTTVDARGENFSHGQRQVLSLCRALVRKSKLMLLDEATASMDYETDAGIQRVLRREMFAAGRDRTLVTIAHRLRTIADYDKVVVMGGGRVLEAGAPAELFRRGGQFREMVAHSGEVQEVKELMGRAR